MSAGSIQIQNFKGLMKTGRTSFTRARVLQILLICLIIALCGCKNGKKVDQEQPPANANDPVTEQSNSPDVNENQGGSEVNTPGVTNNAGENNVYVEMLQSRKSVSESFENYKKWTYTGTTNGVAFFKDAETKLSYGFAGSDFDDPQKPELKGSEIISIINGTLKTLNPGVFIPEDKEMATIYLSVLFGGIFNVVDDKNSEHNGKYTNEAQDRDVFVVVDADQGILKPDSSISINYKTQ